ncbi:MAG: TerC family protein, partial [Candidatus Zixiibacteriota bacterium]
FVGVKMLISGYYKIPDMMALGVIAFLLAVSIIVSILKPHKKE